MIVLSWWKRSLMRCWYDESSKPRLIQSSRNEWRCFLPGNSRDATNYKDILIHNVRQTDWTRPMARHIVPFTVFALSSEQHLFRSVWMNYGRDIQCYTMKRCVFSDDFLCTHLFMSDRMEANASNAVGSGTFLYLLKYLFIFENTDMNSIKRLKSGFEIKG